MKLFLRRPSANRKIEKFGAGAAPALSVAAEPRLLFVPDELSDLAWESAAAPPFARLALLLAALVSHPFWGYYVRSRKEEVHRRGASHQQQALVSQAPRHGSFGRGTPRL